MIADALSRYPTGKAENLLDGEKCNRLAVHVADDIHLRDESIIKQASQNDEGYQRLVTYVFGGFPKKLKDMPHSLYPYWKFKDQLSLEDGVLFKGSQLLVPKSLRSKCLSELHKSHQGVVRTKRRARMLYFWPGMNNDIYNIVGSCEKCSLHQNSQGKEPLILQEAPKIPFMSVSVDMFSCGGKEWLIYTDRTSNWSCVSCLNHNTSTEAVVFCLRNWFSDVGAPKVLMSDNGPQFTSRRFREFCKKWNIEQKFSTPYYPQSNGLAEIAVKSVKKLLLKCSSVRGFDMDEFHKGLLELRNTPGASGLSPAQILYGRPLSSFVLASSKHFAKNWQNEISNLDSFKTVLHEKIKSQYDKTSKTLHDLKIGSSVDIQSPFTKLWSKAGIVVDKGKFRDFTVKLPSGKVIRRNRRFLRISRPSIPISIPLHLGETGFDETVETAQLKSPAVPDQLTVSSQPKLNQHINYDRPKRKRRRTRRMNIWETNCKTYIS